MYPKGRAKTRAGRFTMMADALDRKAKTNPPPANAARMQAQATEMRRMAQVADGISRASPSETVILALLDHASQIPRQ